MPERGKFVAIYGSNNVGKTEQVPRLVDNLRNRGIDVVSVKYPIYDLAPTGPIINEIVRHGRKSSVVAAQTHYAKNRRDYEPTLMGELNTGRWVIAEDYKGTGFAWGMTFGLPFKILEELNWGLQEEDLGILLDGNRFKTGIEVGHIFEQSGRWDKNRKIHQELADIFGWSMVNANQTREKVANDIFCLVRDKFL